MIGLSANWLIELSCHPILAKANWRDSKILKLQISKFIRVPDKKLFANVLGLTRLLHSPIAALQLPVVKRPPLESRASCWSLTRSSKFPELRRGILWNSESEWAPWLVAWVRNSYSQSRLLACIDRGPGSIPTGKGHTLDWVHIIDTATLISRDH